MDNLTPYFQLLSRLRDDLAANLAKMGVGTAAAETLQELVPKVLLIIQGDTSQEVFIASCQETFDVSYGFFSTGETASFAGMCGITAFCRAASLKVEISGTGLGGLAVTAPGWSVTAGDTITLTRAVTARFAAQDALDAISFTGDGQTNVEAIIQVSAVMESGQTIPAAGAAGLYYKYGATWGLVEAVGYTWNALEAQNLTWAGLEVMGKPAT